MKRLMIVISTNFRDDDAPTGLDAVMHDPPLRNSFLAHILDHVEAGEVVVTWDLKERAK